MKVIVDTSVWSEAFRRKKTTNESVVNKLNDLINDFRVQLMDPIRQEILSGIRSEIVFEKIKNQLAAFPDIELNTDDYVLAAYYFNKCRKKGVQGSNTDFLICSAATNRKYDIFTTDKDFVSFQKYLPIQLYS